MKPSILIAIVAAAAGGSSSSKSIDAPGSDRSDAPRPIDAADNGPDATMVAAPPAPAMSTSSGPARAPRLTGTTVVAGVTVGAYRSTDHVNPVTTATTDDQGNFTLTITTGGVALDGYLKGTKTGYVDTYLYP